MPPLASAAGTGLRTCLRQQLPAVRASTVSLQQQRGKASEVSATSSFESPFRGVGSSQQTTNIPDFSKYRSKRGQDGNKVFQYFMVGTMGLLSAAGAKATIQGIPRHYPSVAEAPSTMARSVSLMRLTRFFGQHVRIS